MVKCQQMSFQPTDSLSPVVPAGNSDCPGLPGDYCPHHFAGVCSQDSFQDQAMGPGAHSLGGSQGYP